MNAFECGQYKYMTNIEKGGWKKSYVTKWFQEDQICHFCTLCQQRLLQFHYLIGFLRLYKHTRVSELNIQKEHSF